MKRSKCTAGLGLAVLLAGAGCSSSGSIPAPTPEQLAAAQVEEVMGFVAPLLMLINPFNPAPSIGAGGAAGGCVPIDEEVSCDAGTAEQCGSDTIVFDMCEVTAPQGMISVDGTLIYTDGVDWPDGVRTVVITAPPADPVTYLMTFDGDSSAGVIVTSADLMADCTVNLDTIEATCTVA